MNAAVSAPSAIETAALRSDRFRLDREADWKRLETIVTRMEKGRLKGISDEDLLALPGLYRTVASSLSIARETSLDAATLAYLESLVQRAWFVVYGPRSSVSLRKKPAVLAVGMAERVSRRRLERGGPFDLAGPAHSICRHGGRRRGRLDPRQPRSRMVFLAGGP